MTDTIVESAIEAVDAFCVRLDAKAATAADIAPRLERRRLERNHAHEAIVELHSVTVLQSDVAAAMGLMPEAVFPRTPGREFAGVVVAGPAEWLGVEVFGTAKGLGINQDGAHASHLVIDAAALVRKPSSMTFEQAAGIPLAFAIASDALRGAGRPRPGDALMIYGMNQPLGQAIVQIGAWCGARIIGVIVSGQSYSGYSSRPVETLDSSIGEVPTQIKQMTNGRGADIIINPLHQDLYKSLAPKGRQIFFWAPDKQVQFNVAEFFNGRFTYIGVRFKGTSNSEISEALHELVPGFETGKLQPFPVNAQYIFPLTEVASAYAAIINKKTDRVYLDPTR